MFNVLTHHKCGSSWTERYLGDFCTRNSLAMRGTHFSSVPLRGAINFYRNASYEFLSSRLHSAALHIIRNPLDIVVSAYFSHRNTHDLKVWPDLLKHRQLLQSVSTSEGLLLTLAFLERDEFDLGVAAPLHALRRWNYDDKRILTVRMEDAVSDPTASLGALLARRFPGSVLPSADDHTFKAIAGRDQGVIDDASHYRSGKRDQWKEILPVSVVRYIRTHYGDVLKRYYPDSL